MLIEFVLILSMTVFLYTIILAFDSVVSLFDCVLMFAFCSELQRGEIRAGLTRRIIFRLRFACVICSAVGKEGTCDFIAASSTSAHVVGKDGCVDDGRPDVPDDWADDNPPEEPDGWADDDLSVDLDGWSDDGPPDVTDVLTDDAPPDEPDGWADDDPSVDLDVWEDDAPPEDPEG